MKNFCRSLVVLLCVFVAAGCSDLFDPNADEGGAGAGGNGYASVYDILKERGNHKLFLEAADLSGYSKIMQGSGLVTVFAPEDDEFASYIVGKYKVKNVADIPEEELKILVGFHMVQFSYRPVDLLNFSVSGNAVVPEFGDGSCYKYLTFSRGDVESVTSYAGYKYDVFSREKYLPVVSSELMINRELADPQSDYESLFPEVWWKGIDKQLYAGNARIDESGITALNGYLYIIDNVATPLNTIYDEVHERWAAEYTVFKQLIERVSYFAYDKDLTNTYADFGDSIFLHYTWQAPVAGIDGSEIPELASEWAYHASDAFDRKLKYNVVCLVPTDRHLEPFILNNFKDLYDEVGTENFVSKLPRNVVYHLLRTFLFDKRDIVFPSELAKGFYGNNGEEYYINPSDIQDVKMCSNGIFYGLDTLITNSVFNSMIKPLMSKPNYKYYANALTATDLYLQTSNDSNAYTIFARTDDALLTPVDETILPRVFVEPDDMAKDPEFGKYTFQLGTAVEKTSDVAKMINNNMVYGRVAGLNPVYGGVEEHNDDEDLTRYRYYRTIGETTKGRYLYTYEGALYDERDEALTINDTFKGGGNGAIYSVDREFNTADPSESSTSLLLNGSPDCAVFVKLLTISGLSASLDNIAKNAMIFTPCDSAMNSSIAAGYVPYVAMMESVATGLKDSMVYLGMGSTEQVELQDYLRYYFVSKDLNDLNTYILPTLGPTGISSDEPFSERYITEIPYKSESEIERVEIGWSVDDPNVLTLKTFTGDEVKTKLGGVNVTPVQFSTSAVLYVLDGCFNYQTMYEYKY